MYVFSATGQWFIVFFFKVLLHLQGILLFIYKIAYYTVYAYVN